MTALETIAPPLISAASGLCGVFIGGWLSGRNERVKRKRDFIEKQLNELYSPLLSIRKQVRELSELRVRVGQEANAVWQQLCTEAREAGGVQALQRMTSERRAAFDAINDHDNEHWRAVLFPRYKEMLGIFREKFWLAETSTREQFGKLLVYVELWDRHMNNTIPGEVIAKLNVREDDLQALYRDLEDTFQNLRAKLT